MTDVKYLSFDAVLSTAVVIFIRKIIFTWVFFSVQGISLCLKGYLRSLWTCVRLHGTQPRLSRDFLFLGKEAFPTTSKLRIKNIAFKITEDINSGVLHGGEHDDDGSHGHRCCRPECSTASEDRAWVGLVVMVVLVMISLVVMMHLGTVGLMMMIDRWLLVFVCFGLLNFEFCYGVFLCFG